MSAVKTVMAWEEREERMEERMSEEWRVGGKWEEKMGDGREKMG